MEREMRGYKFYDENLERCIFRWEEQTSDVVAAFNSLNMSKA